MSIFASAARCITSLANLGQQGAGLGLDFGGWSGSEPGAEGYAATATNTAADLGSFGAAIGGKVMSRYIKNMSQGDLIQMQARMGGKEGVNDFAKAASIISWTITTVQLLQLTTGFGTPYDGASLKTGSQQFTSLAGQLKSALPDTGWEGDASEAYADLDTALQSVAQKMADLDSQLAALVKNQGEWVTHMQLAFGILNDLLTTALIIELILTVAVPAPAGPAVAKIFAITVASLGISAAVAFLGTLLGYSIENGKKADALADSYAQLVAGIVQNDSVAQSAVSVVGGSTVSSFEAISAGLSTASAIAGGPPVASPAAPAGERAEQRVRQDAQLSAAGPGGAAAPAAPAADYASPSTPTGTMPTLVQAAAMSGQSTNLSGRVSQPDTLVNQARGQLRQLAQTDAQEREPVRPELVGEEAAPAGGAVGAGAAERAPIAVAPARSEESLQPSGIQ
ncbi:EspA/EspE family type VII secretion system effector [Mycobacterium sp. Aquia_213]|uniref:EspA/EspE family type VII secretion system effector n=1 Tax=Mycobacterium sp. Aquia_213 TaxID=2991728 RepID=UPI002270568D|nr:EspA/EspE family type VII secretion system effector [Mycobacterium sp. Aquia_213]WAC89806.1 EspA/EspE family type VII secretion system effector [Mycobacterium sp. Aquia_213]